jgi:hypothetical protein
LPRPIYRYSDADNNALDGVEFAFVYGTDPEVVMQIEAREERGRKHWEAKFARTASAELSLRFREKEIWSVPAISRQDVVKTKCRLLHHSRGQMTGRRIRNGQAAHLEVTDVMSYSGGKIS